METIENTIDHIGSKIKYYRLLNKISLSKLAEAANISKSTLFGLEEGKSNPTISTLINIASTLNISLNELIGNNLDGINSDSNLTLISTPNDEQYKLYKLTLLPNELFKLKDIQATNIEIEVIEGALSLIDKSTTLYAGESTIVNYNRYYKALNSGAVAMLKIYKLQDNFYIREDIFYNSASEKLLEQIIKNSRKKLITRAIFTSITPIGNIYTQEYMNYIEVIANKESHYYIFRRFQGLLGGIQQYLKKLGNKNIKKYNNLNEFINLAITKPHLKKEDINLLNSSVLEDTKELIINSTIESKDNLSIVNSIFDIDNELIDKSSYILLIEELSNELNSKEKITLTLNLYRALEMLYIVDESSLESLELELFTKIIQKLPKALYFAYHGYLDIAVNTIKIVISEVSSYDNGSKFIRNYLKVIDLLKDSVNNYEECVELSTINIVESIAKDLDLSIEIKEFISPVIGDSGLYVYLFKVNQS